MDQPSSKLPPELLPSICLHLDPIDILSFRSVLRKWREASRKAYLEVFWTHRVVLLYKFKSLLNLLEGLSKDEQHPLETIQSLIFVSLHLSNEFMLDHFPQPAGYLANWEADNAEATTNNSVDKLAALHDMQHFHRSDTDVKRFFENQRTIWMRKADFNLLTNIFFLLKRMPQCVGITISDEPVPELCGHHHEAEYRRLYALTIPEEGSWQPHIHGNTNIQSPVQGEILGVNALHRALLVSPYQMREHTLLGRSGDVTAMSLVFPAHKGWERLYSNLTFLHIDIGGWCETASSLDEYEDWIYRLTVTLSRMVHLERLELILSDKLVEEHSCCLPGAALEIFAGECYLPKIKYLRLEMDHVCVKDLTRFMVRHEATLIDTHLGTCWFDGFSESDNDVTEGKGWSEEETDIEELFRMVWEYAARGFRGEDYGHLGDVDSGSAFLENVTIPCPKRSSVML